MTNIDTAPLRLPPPPVRKEIEPGELEDYDLVVRRQANLWATSPMDSNAYFGALLNSPPFAAHLAEMGRLARTGARRGSYTDADRELVDMVLGVELAYNAILYLHVPDALAVGVRLEAIDALRAGDDGMLTGAERQLVEYSRAVISGAVTDEAYAALEARLGRRGAVEFTVFVAHLLCTFRLWQALGVPDVPDAELDAMLAGYRTWATAPPPAHDRIG